MKTKPNTEQFKLKKDPSSFLEGGAADRIEKEQVVEISQKSIAVNHPLPEINKVHREQKVFRLPLDLINALKEESYERGRKKGSRVTETELIEQALRAYLKR
jgi:hypothetical protein